MARYCGAVCRLCRREGEKLFLKGERCYTDKCAVERREGVPGQHGKGRQSFSTYKVQLREKQKIKRMYVMLEQGFRNNFKRASAVKGVTGTNMLSNLEMRLDSVVYRLGFGMSRRHARQLVTHGHVSVNTRKVDVPSYIVRPGDSIQILARSQKSPAILAALAAAQTRPLPAWLALDKDNMKGTINAMPTREQMPQGIKEQLVVELYSR